MERFPPLFSLIGLLAVILVAGSPAYASSDEDEACLRSYEHDLERRLELLRKDAGNDVRIMNVAAHPDDEDGASLTLLRHHYGYRTHIVFVTRGEGGQNETGPELGDALGVIRSSECQDAAEGYGATISFLNALDFGYSKTAEETLEHWGRETMVQRMVDEIERFRPHIVLTHHTPHEGHGHHRATSLVLREACRRLATEEIPPVVLLELARGASPVAAHPESLVTVDSGRDAPGLPWTYAGWAHVALRRHRSQGMALNNPPVGPHVKQYLPVHDLGEPTARDPAGGSSLERRLATWLASDDPWSISALARLAPQLRDGKTGNVRPDSDANRGLRATIGRLARGATYQREGWGTPLLLPDPRGTIFLRDPSPIRIESLRVLGRPPGGLTSSVHRLDDSGDGAYGISFQGTSVEPTYPLEEHLRERRAVADSVQIELTLSSGETERLQVPVGPRIPRNHLVPPAHLPLIVPGRDVSIPLRLIEPQADETWAVRSTPPLPWKLRSFDPPDPSHPAPREVSIPLDLDVPHDLTGPVRVVLHQAQRTRTLDLSVLTPKIPEGLQVAFVAGVDTSLALALRAIGVPVTFLESEDLSRADLSPFPVILVDVRAYLVREDLQTHNERLWDYARQGGHLVVQYQKTFEWNVNEDGTSPWAPMPLRLGRGRVVDETAAVERHHPEHPFWHYPHELRDADWEGWVQERGLYFPATWDGAYTSLVSMADRDEDPQHGSILTASLGRGAYTYTSLVWYRQLRAGVPGAYRAFLNLLCWPLAPS